MPIFLSCCIVYFRLFRNLRSILALLPLRIELLRGTQKIWPSSVQVRHKGNDSPQILDWTTVHVAFVLVIQGPIHPWDLGAHILEEQKKQSLKRSGSDWHGFNAQCRVEVAPLRHVHHSHQWRQPPRDCSYCGPLSRSKRAQKATRCHCPGTVRYFDKCHTCHDTGESRMSQCRRQWQF